MEQFEQWISSISPVVAALMATTFTWMITALGAALVFFTSTLSRKYFDLLLGFAGGVMVAASFWSLLDPAIEISEKLFPRFAWMPAAVGFGLGGLFLYALDKLLPHLHVKLWYKRNGRNKNIMAQHNTFGPGHNATQHSRGTRSWCDVWCRCPWF